MATTTTRRGVQVEDAIGLGLRPRRWSIATGGSRWGHQGQYGWVYEVQDPERCAIALGLATGTPPPNRLLVEKDLVHDIGCRILTRRGGRYGIELARTLIEANEQERFGIGVIVGFWREGETTTKGGKGARCSICWSRRHAGLETRIKDEAGQAWAVTSCPKDGPVPVGLVRPVRGTIPSTRKVTASA